MAVVAKVLAKKERIGILQRSKNTNHWAAAADTAANAAFKEIHWLEVGQAVPDAGITVDQFNVTSQNGIHIESERRFVDPLSGLIRVPFLGTADKSTLSIFLASAMQAVTEVATTPYKKIFTAIGLTSVPNFATNGGYLYDIAIINGASADDGILIKRCIIDTLNISVNFRAKGIARLFKISGSFVANEILYKQTCNGTWTNTAAQTFLNNTDTWGMVHSSDKFTVASLELDTEFLHDFNLTINNKIEGDNFGTSGVAGQYTMTPEYSCTVNFWHNEVTEGLIDALKDDDEAIVVVTNDSAAAFTDGMLTFVASCGKATSGSKLYDGDYIKEQLNLRLYSKAAATPITITFTDTIDYNFPAP
jgi:hypothetical protein